MVQGMKLACFNTQSITSKYTEGHIYFYFYLCEGS